MKEKERSSIQNQKVIFNFYILVDERLISTKMKSPHKYGGPVGGPNYPDYSDRSMQFRFNPLLMNNEIDLPTRDYSYRLLKSLQLSHTFKSKLRVGYEVDKEQIDLDAERLGITDSIDSWINNLKLFILSYLIPSLLDNHFENLDHINKVIENSLGFNLKIVNSVIDDSEQANFYEEIARLIRDKSSVGPSLHLYPQGFRSSVASGFNLLPKSNIQMEEERKQAHDNYPYSSTFHIFFGDNEKLRFLIDRIEEKIRFTQISKEKLKSGLTKHEEDYSQKDLTKTLFSKRYDILSERKTLSSKMHSFHPMFSKHRFYSENESFENREANLIEVLKKLREFISFRIHLNDVISPLFLKEQSFKHKQLVV